MYAKPFGLSFRFFADADLADAHVWVAEQKKATAKAKAKTGKAMKKKI